MILNPGIRRQARTYSRSAAFPTTAGRPGGSTTASSVRYEIIASTSTPTEARRPIHCRAGAVELFRFLDSRLGLLESSQEWSIARSRLAGARLGLSAGDYLWRTPTSRATKSNGPAMIQITACLSWTQSAGRLLRFRVQGEVPRFLPVRPASGDTGRYQRSKRRSNPPGVVEVERRTWAVVEELAGVRGHDLAPAALALGACDDGFSFHRSLAISTLALTRAGGGRDRRGGMVRRLTRMLSGRAGSRRTSCVPYMLCDKPRARLHRIAWHIDDRVAQVEIDLADSLSERLCRLEGHLSVAVGDIDLRPCR